VVSREQEWAGVNQAAGFTVIPVAVENDYALLVHNLNELAKTISSLRDEVESRRLLEAKEHRQPNETDWVNASGLELQSVDHIFNGLRTGVREVLGSKPGVAVLSAQPPSAPDQPPESPEV
jgi:hypothetical protein